MRNIEDLLQGINIGVAVGLALSDNKTNTLELYKNIMQNSILPTEGLVKNYSEMLSEKADFEFKQQKYDEAVLKYLDIFKTTKLEKVEYRNIAVCLLELKQIEAAKAFLQLYEEVAPDDFVVQKDLGWIYFKSLEDYEKAIYHYEKAIGLSRNDSEVFNILGHVYATYYKDKFLDKQYEYFYAAYDLKKNNRIYIRNLIYTLFRQKRFAEVEDFYAKLLNLNPEHADYYYYGCYLISQKRFAEGYKYLRHRFEKEGDDKAIIPAVLPTHKSWQGESLVGKKILVHCEQGFGDTIMYSRFVKPLSKLAKKVYFVVQEELFSLINSSDLGAEIYSTEFELSKLDYDYFTTTVDLPFYLGLDADNVLLKEGYLKNKSSLVLNSKNYKIGIAYQGSAVSKRTGRDITIQELAPLFDIEDVDFYSLQVDGVELPNNIVDLGKDFQSFDDTAAVIMAMDIIVTTDNAILNLAGALGKPTLGLFNRFAEYRWFDIEDGKPLKWYDKVKVFQNNAQDDWKDTIKHVRDEIIALKRV